MSELTAIVTGAGKRVGAVIAAGLIADGWTVVAHVHHDGDDVPAGIDPETWKHMPEDKKKLFR